MTKKLHASKLGAAIHDYRILQNLSLYELQEKTRIHRMLLYSFEHGRIEPTVVDIYQISKNMGISIEELYAYAESIPDPKTHGGMLNDYLLQNHRDLQQKDTKEKSTTDTKKEEQMICFYILSHSAPSNLGDGFNDYYSTGSPKH